MASKEGIDIFTIVLFGSLGIIALVLFIVVFVVLYQKKMLANKALFEESDARHQRRLLDATIEVAERERHRIASNVHDDVGLILSTIKLNLSRMTLVSNDKQTLKELAQQNAGMIDETIRIIRAISFDIMPKTLLRAGYAIGIKEMCNQINASGQISVTFSSEAYDVHLDQKNEIQVYRIVKEVTNNIIKHSGASAMDVTVSCSPTILSTVITHNGKGITMQM
ncbi:MAG: sensor histidine kinase, partial [Bacteroidia bacterium]